MGLLTILSRKIARSCRREGAEGETEKGQSPSHAPQAGAEPRGGGSNHSPPPIFARVPAAPHLADLLLGILFYICRKPKFPLG